MNSLSKAIAQCRLHNPGLRVFALLKNHTATSAAGEIVIPKRIPRGPTDILKALSETITRDPTAPDFKFQDDPFLYPVSSPQKRTYILAYESGRKAARWVRDQHPELFQQIIAEPAVEAYKPKLTVTGETPVTEETLLEMIDKVYVKNAIQVFLNLKNSGKAISADALQSLLELVSFYNCEEPIPEEEVEERWYAKSESFRNYSTWNGEIPQRIFELIEEPGTAAYSALLCGMLRYGEVTQAEDLLAECKAKSIPLDIKVYDHQILSARSRFGVMEKRWEYICNTLREMENKNIAPTIRIFNSVVEAVAGGTISGKKLQCAFMTLGEMRKLGIKPSLATYQCILYVLQYGGHTENTILRDILCELDDKPLEIVDKRDTRFFMQAMSSCQQIYKDLALARRVDKLLNRDEDNKRLIGSSIYESVYYRCYLLLLCEKAPVDEVFSMYNTLVPNIYSPEPSVVIALVKLIRQEKRPEFVKVVFDYIEASNQTGQQELAETLLDTCVHVGGGEHKEKYASSFAYIADQILENLSNLRSENYAGKLILTEKVAGAALVLVARDKRVADVKVLIDLFQTNCPGSSIDVKYLKELADLGIELEDPDVILWVIQLSLLTDSIRIEDVVAKLCKKMTLPSSVDMALSQILGDETLKKIKEKNPVGLPDDSDSGSSSSSSSSSSSESDDESGSDEDLGVKK